MAKKSKSDEAEGAADTALIKVVAKQPQGRCRAGFQFTTEPREVEVTEAQYEMIKADPILSIVHGDFAIRAPAGAEA
jgi:hypothetical protein